MPTMPEFDRRFGKIRSMKVSYQFNANQFGRTSRNVCVGRKVTVNLSSKSIHEKQTSAGPSVPPLNITVDQIDNVPEIISKYRFFKKPPCDEHQPVAGLIHTNNWAQAAKLGKKVF